MIGRDLASLDVTYKIDLQATYSREQRETRGWNPLLGFNFPFFSLVCFVWVINLL